MPGGRRQPSSHLGRPVGRAVARAIPYRPRTYLQAVARAQLRRRTIHARLRGPVGRALGRTYARPLLVILQAAERAMMPQRRRVRSLLARPVGRATARTYAYPIRTYELQANRRATQRRRDIASVLRRPVGRALARLAAYPVKVVLAVKRAMRQDRRAVHSRRTRRFGSLLVIVYPRPVRRILTAAARGALERRRPRRDRLARQVGRALARGSAIPIGVFTDQANRRAALRRQTYPRSRLRGRFGTLVAAIVPRPVRRALVAVARATLVRRRVVRNRLGRQVGRAASRSYPYPLRVVLQGTERAGHPGRRRVRSAVRRRFGFLRFPPAIRVRLAAVQRAMAPQRRRVRSRLARPVGRALAKLVPYRIRIALQGRNRQGLRERIVNRSVLHKAFGSPLPPNTGGPVSGPTRLLGQAANRLLGMLGRNRMGGGGSNQMGGE